MLYKIGEFSNMTGLSVKTLRYYDDIDLFKPIDVDLFTGYRYYSTDQIYDLELINVLKSVGFSLEEIKNNWDSFTVDLFNEKKDELLKDIGIKQKAIKKIDELKSNLNNGKIRKRKENTKKVKSLY